MQSKKWVKIATMLSLAVPVSAHAAEIKSTSDEVGVGIGQILSGEFWLTVMGAFVVFFVGLLVAMVVRFLVLRTIERARGDFVKETTKILVGRTVFFSVVCLAMVVAANMIGLDLWALIGALGLGIGFALKDLLSNFVAGVIILCQEKINIGDLIRVYSPTRVIFGTIMDITSRATILHAFDGTEVIIPNSDMISRPVVCYNANPFRRIQMELQLGLDSDIDLARDIALEIMRNMDGVESQPSPTVSVAGIIDGRLQVFLRFWIQSRCRWVPIRTMVLREVKKAYAAHGIIIPAQIRSIQMPSTDQGSLQQLHQYNQGLAEARGLDGVAVPTVVPQVQEVQIGAVAME